MIDEHWVPAPTERLRFRRFTMDDVDALVDLDSDPEVMRYLTGGVPTPRDRVEEKTRGHIAEYERFTGLGRWMAEFREGGAFVGGFALSPTGEGEFGLGYRLRREHWGSGLATEGTRALVDIAFMAFGAQRVWAETMAVNNRSRRVMEKSGLRFERGFHLEWDDPIDGVEHGEVEYALTRAEWLGGK